jgi:hypothetical protein
MMNIMIRSEIYRWLVLGMLGVLVVVITGVANRNVYTKAATDEKIRVLIELHDKDVGSQQRQLNRIEKNLDKLVDKLIEVDE